MQVHVAHLLRQPQGYEARHELRQTHLRLEDVVLSDLRGEVALLRTDRGVLVSVVASSTIRETCSRCLADMDYRFSLDFQEEYLPTVDVQTGLPLPLPEDGDNFLIGADFVLDLEEALRQYLVMGKPAKPLCQPQCRGLCPRCGQDINRGLCSCPQEGDDRWETIGGLAETLRREERS